MEEILSDLENQLAALSTLMLDITTGYLSLLCCRTGAESALVMDNFRDNVYSMKEEFMILMERCEHKKRILQHMIQDGIKEERLILKK